MLRTFLLPGLLAILLLPALANAQNSKSQTRANSLLANQGLSFTPNQGQLSDENGKSLKDVLFYGSGHGVNVYLRANKLSFVFAKMTEQKESGQNSVDPGMKKPSPMKVEAARIDMVLIGANPTPTVINEGASSSYTNYYNPNTPEGAKAIKSFSKLTFKNIYPEIDMVLKAGNQSGAANSGMEYEFVVHPGGKISDIKLQWDGAQNIARLENGGLRYENILGVMNESKPVCFLQGGREVKSSFAKNDNVISFNIENYDKTRTLVIDPALSWVTYYGGSAADFGYDVEVDPSGDIYLGGSSASSAGIATSGAFKTTLTGSLGDIMLAKFTSAGSRLWATYYGGTSEDRCYNLASDNSGNIYVTGFARSSGLATTGAHQTAQSGNDDCIIIKFDGSGSRQWATYYGGSNEDLGSGIVSSSSGLYLWGHTASSSGIATASSYQSTFGGGSYDAWLAKFDNSGVLQWGTYYGGSGNDLGLDLTADLSGNLCAVGTTTSVLGIATGGSFQSANNGGSDGMVVKFDNAGNFLWSSYYGGTANDNGEGIATDPSGNVFITGITGSSTNIASGGVFQSTFGGNQDAFLAKFNSSGTWQWGTYFGGSDIEYGLGVKVDLSGNPYITGMANSFAGIASSGAYQTSYSGNSDAYLAGFNTFGTRLWSTYLGSNNFDYTQNISIDASNNAYLAGYSTSTTPIATSGAFQTVLAGLSDAILARYGITGSAYAGPDASICIGGSTTLGASPVSGHTYSWTSNPAGFTSSLANPSVSPGANTTYYLIDSSVSGNGSDSVTVTVLSYPSANAGLDDTICDRDTVPIGSASVSGLSYSWTSNPSGFTSTSANPFATPSITTDYYLMVSNAGGCSAYDTVKITVKAAPTKPISYSNSPVCAGSALQLYSTYVGSYAYEWTGPNGYTSTQQSPAITAVTTAATGIYSIRTLDNGCYSLPDTINATVFALPAAANSGNQTICNGNSTSIGASPVSSSVYYWTSSPFGFSTTISNPTVSPALTRTYYLTETDTNTGCFKTNQLTVFVKIAPGAPSSASNNGPMCAGGTLNLSAASVAGSTYSWTGPNGFTSTLQNPSISNADAINTGLYSVKSVFSGCPSISAVSTSATVYARTLPSIMGASSICIGSTTADSTTYHPGSTYTWSVTGGNITSGQNTQAVSVSWPSSGSFTLKVVESNSNGCKDSSTINVTVNPLPVANAGNPAAITFGSSVTIGDTLVSGMNYSWTSNPSGFTSTLSNPNVSPAVTTTYYLTVTNSITGCGAFDSVTIVVNAITVNANAGADKGICPGQSTAIGASSTGGHAYSWTSLPSGFTSSSSNPTVSPTGTTTYIVVESYLGLNDTDSVVVTMNPLPAANPGTSHTICSGNTTSIGATVVPGSTYSWTSIPSGFTSTLANPSVSPTTLTTYYLTETSAAGCTKSDSVYILVNTSPPATVATNQTVCGGTSVGLGGFTTPGNTYSWTSNPAGFTSTLSNPTINPLTTKTYYLTETVGGGCSKSDSVKITVNARPAANAGANVVICVTQGVTIGVAAVPGSTYSWTSNPASGFISPVATTTVAPTTTTVYTLTETVTATGCSNTGTMTITLNTPQAKTGPSRTICAGTPTQIGDTMIAGHTFNWSSSPTGFTSTLPNPIVSPTATTTYSLVEGNTACVISHSMTITVNPLPAANAGFSQTLCGPGNLTLGSTAISGNTYSWTSNRGGFTSTLAKPTFFVDSPTIFTLVETVTATGCTKSNSVTIGIVSKPTANIGGNIMLCPGSSTTLGSNVTTGNIYSWTSNPSGFTATTASISISPSSTTTYILVEKVTGFTTCATTKSVIVTVSIPAGGAGNGRQICVGNSTTMGAGQIGLNTYSWTSSPAGFTSTLPNPTVSPTVSTTYTVVETAIGGCTNSHSATVFVNPLPVVNAGSNQTISGGSVTIGSAAVAGNTYSWTSNPSGFTSTVANPSVSPVVTTTYTLTQTKTSTGCSNTGSVTITHSTNGQISELHQMTGIDAAGQPAIGSMTAMPNPFREELNVKYTLTKSTRISLEITDVLGRQIIPLVNTQQEPGEYNVNMNATNNNLKSGIYFIRLKADKQVISQKVVKVE